MSEPRCEPFCARRLTLSNGTGVRIRALARGEADTIRELFARLSPRTRQLRFFLPMPMLPDSLVQLLADVDGDRRLALVAEVDASQGGAVVGLANLGGMDDDCAEVGFVVADAWQRMGIGVALATGLFDAAAARGYDRFVVHGLWDNPALRPFLNRTAEVVSTTTRLGVSEIAFVRRRPAVLTRALESQPRLEDAKPGAALDQSRRVTPLTQTHIEATRSEETIERTPRLTNQSFRDPVEQAYERILAAQGRKHH